MNKPRNLADLQMNAIAKRADETGQSESCHRMLERELGEGEILIALEREFFIGRRQSTHILETCKLFIF